MLGFGQRDRSVAGLQIAGRQGPLAGPPAIGAGLGLLDRSSGLLGGGLLTDLTRDGPPDGVGHVLDVAEMDVGSDGIGAVHSLPDDADQFLELRVVGIAAESGAKHGEVLRDRCSFSKLTGNLTKSDRNGY